MPYELSDIEDFFNSQRAKVRWPFKRLDPLDWAMMDAWQKDGIAFGVICRGIEETITNHVRRQAQGRVNTVRYCESAIKRHWKDHIAAHVGSNGGESAAGHQAEFGVEAILEALQHWIEALTALANRPPQPSEPFPFSVEAAVAAANLCHIRAGLSGQINYEKLDAQLAEIEAELLAQLLAHAGESQIAQLTIEAEKQFANYKDRMMPGVWRETVNKAVHKKLREQYRIPRLSLFYL